MPPQPRWVDEFLIACHHPMTVREAPGDAKVTREQLRQFLSAAPFGHDLGNDNNGRTPGYHFWMMLRYGPTGPAQRAPLRIAGGIALRIGWSESIQKYFGHFGYHVYPTARGHAYAERACRLLIPLARAHGLQSLWITCNPDNHASRRTCVNLGASLVDIIEIPPSEPLYARGERQKCRYRLDV